MEEYEDIRIAMLLLNKNDFLFKFDLKSRYHHLDIFEPHQSYLGFTWEWNNMYSPILYSLSCLLGYPQPAMLIIQSY